ncbi:hypothetical protein DRQ53_05965 [bacterium]|nr:MAG: hypothetical protein DRQ53_05965 [bacterium]
MHRFMPPLLLLAVVLTAVFVPPVMAAELTPLLDLRVRQEILDGVYHFASDKDRDWIRIRTRAGARLDLGAHRLEFRVNNEHRYFISPDQESDFDEIILDRGFWSWQSAAGARITAGRQDIIWPGGFLMLEGHPLDGSRSIYHNALRLQWGGLDASAIYNPKYDPIVLIDDEDRALTDADEAALAVRYARGGLAGATILKFEHDPDDALDDLVTATLSSSYESDQEEPWFWRAEAALQFQDGTVRVAREDLFDDGSGWAFAGEAAATVHTGTRTDASIGAFYYSGLDGGLRPFRTPWGRWPRWSELYIYSLIGESTPGRVHVAAWEDIAAPRFGLRHRINDHLTISAVASYLVSPATGDARGLLTELGLKARIGAGFTGHLLWEMFDPGAFHDGRYGLPAMTSPVHFLRWQLSWALPSPGTKA